MATHTDPSPAPRPSSTTADSTQGDPFKRTLSVFDMVVYGLIFMVPIAPFSIFGDVFESSNGMPALAYLIGMVAVIFTALSFGVMVRRFPSSGSIYAYTTGGMGKGIGFIAGWLMLLQYLVLPDLMYIMASQALSQYLPSVPQWIWCVIFIAFVTAVTLRGIKTTIIVDRIALVVELIVLGMFIAFGVHYVLAHPSDASFSATALVNPKAFNLGDMLSAVSLCIFSFVGFGSIATLSEQAKDGRRGPAKAMLIAVLILGAIFAVLCFVATCVDPNGQAFIHNPDNGFYILAQMVGGSWFGVLCAVAVAIALGVFTALAAQSTVSRILYSMGKSGALPRALGKLHPKTNAPVVAILFVSALSLVMLTVMLPLGMDNVTKVSNFGALSSYFLLNICVVWYYWIKLKDHSNPLRLLICPIVGAVVVGALVFSLNTVAHIAGIAWIIVGVAYYLIETRVLHHTISMGE